MIPTSDPSDFRSAEPTQNADAEPPEPQAVPQTAANSTLSSATVQEADENSMSGFLETPAPLVITGETAAELSDFLQNDLVARLDLGPEASEALLFTPQPETGILGSLAEALSASFPGLTRELLETVSPNQWGYLLRALIRNSVFPRKRRVLIVDDLEAIFLAPHGEREHFTRILAQIAREPSVTVIVGIPEGSVTRCRKLPGLKQSIREGAQFRAEASDWATPKLSRSSRAAQRLRNGGDSFSSWILDVSDAISDMAVGRMAAFAVASAAVIGLAVAGLAFFVFSGEEPPKREETPNVAAVETDPAEPVVVAFESDETESGPAIQQLPEAKGTFVDPQLAEAPIAFGEGETIEIIMSDDPNHSVPPKNLTPVSGHAAEKAEAKPGNQKTRTQEDDAPAGDDDEASDPEPGTAAPDLRKEASATSSADASSGREEDKREPGTDE